MRVCVVVDNVPVAKYVTDGKSINKFNLNTGTVL